MLVYVCSGSSVLVFNKSGNIVSVYWSNDTHNYTVYRVLDNVCLRLATFRENLLSSSGKGEDDKLNWEFDN